MKPPVLVAGGLLALAIAAAFFLSRPSSSDSAPPDPDSPPAMAATRPGPAADPFSNPDRSSGHAGHRIAESSPDDALPLDHGFLRTLSEASRATLPVPAGDPLPLTITRREAGPHGEVVQIEGTLDHPAPGRFLFRRQPEGVLPGPMVGFVYFPSLDFGYRVETINRQAWLVRRPADAIACIRYAPPVAPEPEEIPAEHPTGIPIPEYQNGVIPLQSLPGATGVIYLDFDGEEGPHGGWGDFDAAASGSTNAEIFDVWKRVAEDFAPFNLNVTTDLQVYLDAPETSRQRCIVTPTTDAAPAAGGVAYLNSFNWSGDTPCWAFYSRSKASAEVISHEIGHTLSLSHDGRTTPSEGYYGGHGSGETGWAPIMGVGYYKNLTQWSKGEYLNANQTQDDLFRIIDMNNSVDYRADDHEATHAAASHLGFNTSGQADDEGIVETDGDIDAFLFTTSTGGTINLSIDPVALGPNLDILAELYNDTETLITSSNPADDLDATLSFAIAAGTYTIRVTNTGKGDPLGTGYTSYASLGQYTITGTIPGAVLPERLEIAENSALNAPAGTVTPRTSHGANPLTWSIASGNGLGAFQINPGTGEISVASPAVLDYEVLSSGWHDPPVFELVVAITDTIDPGLNESIRVLVSVLDVNESPSIAGTTLTILEHTRIGRALHAVVASDPDQFDLLSYAITAGDPAGRFTLDANGVLSPAADLAYADQAIYNLTVTATDSGTPGLTAHALITVNLLDTVEGYTPGSVEHTFYRGIAGTNISDLTSDPDFPHCPDDIDIRDEIHADGEGDNYGRSVRAFLLPPLTGNYTFWIAGDDSCELLMSTDHNLGNTSTIADINGHTDYQQWTKFGSQKSSIIPLVAGQAYYLEARQKEGGGGDHLSLAWEIRDGSNNLLVAREPIPGFFLAPHALNYCPRLGDASTSVRDDAFPGTQLHQFAASDLNAGDGHSYTITGGDPGGKFAINPSTGVVTLADPTGLASSYSLTVTTTDNGSPGLSESATLAVTVFPAATIRAVEPLMEFWDNLGGTSLSTLTSSPLFPDRPERLSELTDLDSGENRADSYGARIRAYLTPPATGAYTFYLASDDNGALLLDTGGDNPSHASVIASVSGWTGYHQWDKAPAEQTSSAVTLTANQRYFLEVRVKEGGGGDHAAVAWTGPGIGTITVIDSSLIEPYDSNVAPDLSPTNPVLDLPAAPMAGTALASFSAIDSPFDATTFAILAGNEAGVFAIDPQSGKLTLDNPAALHTGPYSLTVGVQDSGHGGYFPLLTATTTATVHIDDSDRDGLPDSWELARIGSLADDGNDDSDLDGLTNRAEFVFGSHAGDPSSIAFGPQPNGVSGGGTFQFELVVRSDLPPDAYALHISTGLDAWSILPPWVAGNAIGYLVVETTPVDASHDRLKLIVTQPGERCFLKAGAHQ